MINPKEEMMMIMTIKIVAVKKMMIKMIMIVEDVVEMTMMKMIMIIEKEENREMTVEIIKEMLKLI